jgi:hypothetical protein
MKHCPGCNAPVPEHYKAEMLCVICLRFGLPEIRNKLEKTTNGEVKQ